MSKVFKTILPIAASFIPGIGPIASAAIGAGAGALGGGGLKGALLGGLGGFAGGGGLGTVAGAPLAGGIGPTAGSGVLGALTRGAGSGGLAGALGTGIKGITSALGVGGGGGGLGGAISSIFPNSGATAIPGVGGGGLAGIFGGGGGLGNILTNAYSGISSASALKKMQQQQLAAQNQALEAISPFAASGAAANTRLSSLLGLNGEDSEEILSQLRTSPGYQFQLEQGGQAIDRSAAARGNLFSGRTMQEQQRLGQGLADQNYNQYANQLAQQSGQGYNAALGQGAIYDTMGDIRANTTGGIQDAYNKSLANIFAPKRYGEEDLSRYGVMQ